MHVLWCVRVERALSVHIRNNLYFPDLRRNNSVVHLPVYATAFNCSTKDKVGFADCQGKSFNFWQLRQGALHVASQLRSVVSEPSRVTFLCPRDASFPAVLWGSWLGGHTGVPLSEKHPDKLLEYYIKASLSRITVTTPQYARRLQFVKAAGSELIVIDFETLAAAAPSIEDNQIYPDPIHQDALILFTSGTTGEPKGVLLTHDNLNDQVKNICDSFEITSADTLLHVLPLHHTHGVVHALVSPLSVGARCHMLEKFDAAVVWKELLSHECGRPTVLMGVPTVYVKLIEEYERNLSSRADREFVRETCLDKMRLFLSGSASLPVPVLEKWEEITGHRILERYGMTEVGVILSNPLRGNRRPGFVGTPFPSVRIRVANVSSRKSVEILAEGDAHEINFPVKLINKGDDAPITGDLFTKGPSVFKGYFNNPEATAKEFTEDGWFITGDVVEYSDGAFRVLGRKSVDIIKSGGYKLSALEIETQLLSLDEILEVSVVGLPDSTWGQVVAAVIVWRYNKSLSLSEFKEKAKYRLPHYMVPSVIRTVTELPRNHLGKVNKKELSKIFNIQ